MYTAASDNRPPKISTKYYLFKSTGSNYKLPTGMVIVSSAITERNWRTILLIQLEVDHVEKCANCGTGRHCSISHGTLNRSREKCFRTGEEEFCNNEEHVPPCMLKVRNEGEGPRFKRLLADFEQNKARVNRFDEMYPTLDHFIEKGPWTREIQEAASERASQRSELRLERRSPINKRGICSALYAVREGKYTLRYDG